MARDDGAPLAVTGVLHPPARSQHLSRREVHRRGALLLWAALAAAAGATNVLAFLACARFVTHVTGIATNIGLDAADLEHAIDYSLVLLAFVAGAGASELVLGSDSIRAGMTRALLLVAGIFASVATAGAHGAFDPFGHGVEDARTFVFLGALAFAMGLQNAAIATATSGQVRTTHMTGAATDLGVALARLRSGNRKRRVAAHRQARSRGATLGGFVAGAALGAAVAPAGYLALCVPVAICTAAAFILRNGRSTRATQPARGDVPPCSAHATLPLSARADKCRLAQTTVSPASDVRGAA